MKKTLAQILALVVVGTIWFGISRGGLLTPETAYAIGDLIIDWGVPAGSPIFVVNNFAPGEEAARQVEVANGGPIARELGIRGVKTNELGALGNALEIKISEGGVDLYGGASPTGVKTLNQFFTDSANPNGISLLTINPSEILTLNFTVKFSEAAGNAFQNANIIFDITLGITGEVAGLPSECAGLTFSGAPIFGTAGGDSIRGTVGNDLIFGLEGGDAISGNGGDDCIVGGLGGDSLKGGQGADVLVGGEGGDSLDGGNGNDRAFGENGGDSLRGGNGNDELIGGAGGDAARGEAGTDRCEAESERTCEL